MKVVSLFIAGGVGKRLWPKSDISCPKQFCDLLMTGKTLIQESIDRMSFISETNDIFIVTDKCFGPIIEKMNLSVPLENILYEPCGKNTSAAINLSIAYIKSVYKEDVVVIVLPCDHYINKVDLFRNAIKEVSLFCCDNDAIVTIGIKPNLPNTNYGYIKLGCSISDCLNKVDSFTEKPNIETASMYLSTKKYLWNSGVYVFRLSVAESAFKKYANSQYVLFESLSFDCSSLELSKQLEHIYKQLSNISFDKAIAEKSLNLYCYKGSFDWDDLGTWSSIEHFFPKDCSDNIINNVDNSIIENCNNVTLLSYDNQKIIVSGLDNILVVNANEKILIIKKDRLNDLSCLVEKLDLKFSEEK